VESSQPRTALGPAGRRTLLLVIALAIPRSAVGCVGLALVFGWFGVSHVVAAATAYPGCPELGAVPPSTQAKSQDRLRALAMVGREASPRE
jgi:hypothetical protein